MDFDSTSFPYSLSSVPADVAEQFLGARPGHPDTGGAPQDVRQAVGTTGTPPCSHSPLRATLSPAMHQQPPQVSPWQPQSQPRALPLAFDARPEPAVGASVPQVIVRRGRSHSEPQRPADRNLSAWQPLDTPSEEDSGSDSVGDCIASLIELSQKSDRPEREEAWHKAMPPLAEALVKLSFRPSSEQASVLAEADALLAAGADLCDTDPAYGRSVLHWTCLLGDALMVDFVLRRGGSRCVNDADLSGQLPLELVCKLRAAPCRRYTLPDASGIAAALLRHGAQVARLPYRGAELLYLPDLGVPLAATLVGMGIPVDGGGAEQVTPLMRACARGHFRLASWLLDAGASARATGRFSSTLLHQGDLPEWLAKRLIMAGARVDARDWTGQTPLMMACEAGNLPLARLLVQCGASVAASDEDGRTVMQYAEQAGSDFTQLVRECLMLQPGLRLANS